MELKGNPRAFHETVEDFFTVAQANHFAGVAHDYMDEIDKDHGRLEGRRYWITEELRTLPDTENWKGLRHIGMVEGKTLTIDQRYFIKSIPAQAEPFAYTVRGHWESRIRCTGDWMSFLTITLAVFVNAMARR